MVAGSNLESLGSSYQLYSVFLNIEASTLTNNSGCHVIYNTVGLNKLEVSFIRFSCLVQRGNISWILDCILLYIY